MESREIGEVTSLTETAINRSRRHGIMAEMFI